MADVAAAAGVSGQTVSRVVNASPRVDPETRARVEAAMAQLGYRPHRAARALRTGRTDTIGLVVSTLATVGNSRMLEAVAAAASRRGLSVTLIALTERRDVADAFERLHELGVDGAVVLNEASAIAEGVTPPTGLALVAVDSPGGSYATVQSDHAGGAEAATRRLLDAGHRSVAHLAGPASSFAAAERERGWRAAHLDAATAPLVRGDWTAASGYRAGTELGADVSAVFAANDQMALGLLRALAEAGREDVAVIGFDDVADAADYRPPLTTIRQDFDALGEAAIAALAATLDGAAPTQTVVPTTLIARASG
ncbi:LacI family DNA-binding transcriptional regulator [Microbacterium dauci]|uniref:LacI family DNA-binding transcriptional regulator n=1 Tax=Microbacterium dauci TaxID=3048008 RepID=A0ABT6ZH95_9MICO|nr:LacI family DNA-binding transcriptional regulator [Microbacterium sp. LX3-4]MDJ1115520.1 LacI family DNA-binding transcriptional regulator [Microbacterium sp. LX3-4]